MAVMLSTSCLYAAVLVIFLDAGLGTLLNLWDISPLLQSLCPSSWIFFFWLHLWSHVTLTPTSPLFFYPFSPVTRDASTVSPARLFGAARLHSMISTMILST